MNNPKKYCFLFLLFSGLLFLAGCSSTRSISSSQRYTADNDSAPHFAVDASNVPDAVPRLEPFSKYGNPHSYVACGRRYYVMSSAKGYCERGIASWYGMKFYKFRTSSGEPYDICKMTAAHKTLPLPTYCSVTNLYNGRQIIVKVNDRGPFVDGRIIDLSYVAAIKLGVTGHGTAHVEVRAIDPRSYRAAQPSRPVAPSAPQNTRVCNPKIGACYLQVGVFSQRQNAVVLAGKVSNCLGKQIPVQVTDGVLKGKKLYRVKIGPLSNQQMANQVCRRLPQSFGKPMIIYETNH